jgi:MarR family transcriptional regulator, organic hydroperoxide resistance regulator
VKKDFGPEELGLRLWRQLYQTYTLLKRCEDEIYEAHGLTTEQYAVLVSIAYLGEPARISDIARWLERSTNSISMIVDRMVKAGLTRRARDKRDRRVVYVSKTGKAESLLGPASVASFEMIQKNLSAMSERDKVALLDLLGELKYETMKCVNPGLDIEKIKRDELKQAANIGKWLAQYGKARTPRARRHAGGKGNTRAKTR